MMIECQKCYEYKDKTEFYIAKDRRSGFRWACKVCNSKESLRWNRENYERWTAAKFKSTYGITIAERDKLFERQGQVCAICKSPTSKSKHGFHTDHDPVSKRVRGILCSTCNQSLGFYEKHILPHIEIVTGYLAESNSDE
jgi:hypothetical protein